MALILSNAIVVDVSHWQPPSSIDWKTAHDQGNVVGAIVKLMQGGSPDTAAVYHLYNAYQGGVPLLGIYDFGTAHEDHVALLQQALKEFSGDLKTRLLVIDSERNPSSQMDVPGMVAWQEGVQVATERWPVSYMGKDGPDGTGRGLPSTELSRGDLWLPKYGPVPDAAHLPAGFRLPTSDAERGGVCRLWQFTGDGINEPDEWPTGIPRKNDLSYPLFETMEGLTDWWEGR